MKITKFKEVILLKRKINFKFAAIKLVLCLIGSAVISSLFFDTNIMKLDTVSLVTETPILFVCGVFFILSNIRNVDTDSNNLAIDVQITSNGKNEAGICMNSAAAERETKTCTAVNKKGSAEETKKQNTAQKVTFADIAGYETTKTSVRFIVKCLKEQKALNKIGAKLPKGILLYGPPGTGKTYMARAIAGEAGVPFYSASASSFVNTYVGVGAKNVRALYETAKKNAPCVVFIDELDAIGGSRKADNVHSELRSTLNELLVQMDGIDSTNSILTIAATNTPEELDEALVRAGRFDRKIAMPLPDMKEREQILQIHCKEKLLADDVDLHKIAISTPGFSGSALATLANEAALRAVYREKQAAEMSDFDDALFQIIMEGEKKKVENQAEIRMIAYHEAGHALAIKLLAKEAVPKVTIIGSTSGAGGVTFRAEDNRIMYSKGQMETQIKISYAGRAAEEIYFGNQSDITTGASADIKQATNLIRNYISAYGMSEDFGMLNMDILVGGRGQGQGIVDEAKRISTRLYSETLNFLRENQEKLVAVAEKLLAKETIFDEDLDEILGSV